MERIWSVGENCSVGCKDHQQLVEQSCWLPLTVELSCQCVQKTAPWVKTIHWCVCRVPVNMLDLIYIWSGLAQKCWLVVGLMIFAHWLASGPDPFDRNHIGSSLVLHSDPGCLWKNATESESGSLVMGWLYSARSGLDDSCTQACFWNRCIWPKPDLAVQIGPGSSFAQYNPDVLWKNRTESCVGSWI